MGLHFYTFKISNLENRKKLMIVRIMNSTNLNNKPIVNSIGISMISILLIKISKNDIRMNIVSCEYSCDEQ